ncbi:MAG: cytochrome c [Candidatus Binatia bacterium]|nr:cytochrome c [Candidatus Binatia bacterium]
MERTHVVKNIASQLFVAVTLMALPVRLLHATETALVARGRYIFALAGGCGCHTAERGPVNAGGRPLKTPYGTFYGTNITPDPTYGIGGWTDRQVIDAIRLGTRPDGTVMSPVMPYPAFSGMSDEDVTALVAYLRTVPAVARANTPHETALPLFNLLMRVWRWVFFAQPHPPATAPREGVERGRYISEHIAHCQECHTPRTVFGTLDRSRYLAGNPDGIDGEVTPNITPDRETGIGDWSENDIVTLLREGFLPNMDNVQGLMALLIDGIPAGGYKDMTEEDARAVARYLKQVPPVVHRVTR